MVLIIIKLLAPACKLNLNSVFKKNVISLNLLGPCMFTINQSKPWNAWCTLLYIDATYPMWSSSLKKKTNIAEFSQDQDGLIQDININLYSGLFGVNRVECLH